jgi:hypothetical protein
MSSKLPTAEVFLLLSNMFNAFDRLTDRFCVYKVETIGAPSGQWLFVLIILHSVA